MFAAEEKKFQIKHAFTDALLLEEEKSHDSPIENHFNVDWHVSIYKHYNGFFAYLDCPKIPENIDYKIKAWIVLKLRKNTGEEELYSKEAEFAQDKFHLMMKMIEPSEVENYLIGGTFTIECQVQIFRMTGIKKVGDSKNFDDFNKEFSDVVLIVKDRKFHVMKHYLASHSSYFKSLFFGNFDESKQTEVELKDIDPKDFQKFLDLLHAKSVINDSTVTGILELSDFFDSETAIRRCEEFLAKTSQKTLKQKFELANKYKLEEAMQKCLSDIKTKAEVRSLIPLDSKKLCTELWSELLEKALTLEK